MSTRGVICKLTRRSQISPQDTTSTELAQRRSAKTYRVRGTMVIVSSSPDIPATFRDLAAIRLPRLWSCGDPEALKEASAWYGSGSASLLPRGMVQIPVGLERRTSDLRANLSLWILGLVFGVRIIWGRLCLHFNAAGAFDLENTYFVCGLARQGVASAHATVILQEIYESMLQGGLSPAGTNMSSVCTFSVEAVPESI